VEELGEEQRLEAEHEKVASAMPRLAPYSLGSESGDFGPKE